MNKRIKSLLLATIFVAMTLPAWGEAIPSTEGSDFWVTFLQAQTNSSELILTISAKEACDVTIENTNANFTVKRTVTANSSTSITITNRNACYSATSEQAMYTALHVTSTKDISLFAGNYISKTFDAANILPTSALLDDYLVQVYPPSDHDGDSDSRGSHFAIVAVEDGETVVDYNLTAKTSKGKIGEQSVTLKKGQVFYVWTGKGAGDAADLSGTTVKARNEKKIAVFQGCPHTNIPYMVRDRDHIFSQAMPIAYWGNEFGITASRCHRRDIVAVMAINDGTEVYVNAKDGEKLLVHTFDFSKDKKHYWTFEIGEELAYCADKAGESPYTGLLPEPLVIDSSCYLTTSCPAGVHLFMVSNRYDNLTPTVKSDTLISDPAMLWISPIEQVIKEINFSTYNKGVDRHFMNILTTTSNVSDMIWTDENGKETNIASSFLPLRGNDEYSYARIEIQPGNHNLKGYAGFLAHVYGYGQRESYAYSCGSSTVARSVSFNDIPVLIDSISPRKFCVGEAIDMKLNIGNNEYETIEWDYGDGVIYSPSVYTSNEEKKKAHHVYNTPGWYDLKVSAVYVNSCTQQRHNETMRISFQVVAPDTILAGVEHQCIHKGNKLDDGTELTDAQVANLLKYGANDTAWAKRENCYDPIEVKYVVYGMDSEYEYDEVGWDSVQVNGRWYFPETLPADGIITWTLEGANSTKCDSVITCHAKIITCLNMEIPNDSVNQHVCYGEDFAIKYNYKKGDIGDATVIIDGKKSSVTLENDSVFVPTDNLNPGTYKATIAVEDPICERTLEFPIDIAVYYPDSIFKYKFNNVLAVYKKGFGGNKGWEFSAYQWYKDGEAIEGANESIYHTEGQITPGEYFVELTNKNGMTIQSCSQDIQIKASQTTSEAPAQKVILNNRMYIQIGDILYDVYGQRMN